MTTDSETRAIAESILPVLSDDSKKGLYLSYRVANFTVSESVQLSKIHMKTVRRWREADEQFRYLDMEGITELRKAMANQFIDMQFTRNFHLVLQKDFRILYKDAMADQVTTNPQLTEQEQTYLKGIRQHYTPQSLAMVKQLLAGGTVEEPFNFTKVTMTIRRQTEQVEITQEQ